MPCRAKPFFGSASRAADPLRGQAILRYSAGSPADNGSTTRRRPPSRPTITHRNTQHDLHRENDRPHPPSSLTIEKTRRRLRRPTPTLASFGAGQFAHPQPKTALARSSRRFTQPGNGFVPPRQPLPSQVGQAAPAHSPREANGLGLWTHQTVGADNVSRSRAAHSHPQAATWPTPCGQCHDDGRRRQIESCQWLDDSGRGPLEAYPPVRSHREHGPPR